MAWHLLRIMGKGLAACASSIQPDCLAQYCAYHNGMNEKKEGRKRGAEELMTALTKWQQEATRKLQVKYEGDPKPVNSSISIGDGQMTIDVGMERASQLDIRKSNNAAMEMAIADFFHCENISDWDAESSQFCQMIKLASLVRKDFVVPNKKNWMWENFLCYFSFFMSKCWILMI